MNIYITIGGQGTRLKSISPIDKHLLYFGAKTIAEQIMEIFPTAKLLGNKKTNSRRETLEEIKNQKDCLIVDCDIIPYGFVQTQLVEDTIYFFESEKNKYGSILLNNNLLEKVSEKQNISNFKCSGLYFVKSVERLLSSMKDDNSIASGMIGAKAIKETTFIRVGDVEDYYEALKF